MQTKVAIIHFPLVLADFSARSSLWIGILPYLQNSTEIWNLIIFWLQL